MYQKPTRRRFLTSGSIGFRRETGLVKKKKRKTGSDS